MSDEIVSRLLEDQLLHRIPAEWPQAFLRLPWLEQRWRGRVFLVAWITGGSVPFAWSMALTGDPEAAAENRATVAEIPDTAIAEGLDFMLRPE